MRCSLPLLLLTALVVVSGEGEKPIMCYLLSWAIYRDGDGKFTPDDINPSLCSHIVYGNMGLNGSTFSITSKDQWADFKDSRGKGLGTIKNLVLLKRRWHKLKILVSIGGWSEGSVNFSVMSDSSSKRTTFVNSILDFLRDNDLDGLDINWEYPADRGGIPEDKTNFIHLLKVLNGRFKERNYLLTVHLSGKRYIIDASYDIEGISRYADYLGVVTYQYNGPWEELTGINAPLHDSTEYNVEDTVEYLLKLGAPANKILMGFATYGHNFITNEKVRDNKYFRVPATESFKGKWTDQSGFMGYNEVCWNLTNGIGWKELWDRESSTPFAVNGKQIVSYDNVRSFKKKLEYLDEKGLGGAMLYSLDTDDFRGLCDGKKFPLLSEIKDYFSHIPAPTYPVDSKEEEKDEVSVVTFEYGKK